MHFYDIEIFVQYVTLSLKLKLMKLFLKTLCNAYMTLWASLSFETRQRQLAFECIHAFSWDSSFRYSWRNRGEFALYIQYILDLSSAHASALRRLCKISKRIADHTRNRYTSRDTLHFRNMNVEQNYIVTRKVPDIIGKKFTISDRNNYHVRVIHGQKVFFKREPDNSNDPNAIVVYTYERNIIGLLKKDNAAF